MVDFKIKNGDIAVDSAGQIVKLDEKDALFQKAVICMSARYGKFIYDRELGSHAVDVAYDEDYVAKLEFVLNESLAEFNNASVKITECGQVLLTEVCIDGETRTEEVLLSGNL